MPNTMWNTYPKSKTENKEPLLPFQHGLHINCLKQEKLKWVFTKSKVFPFFNILGRNVGISILPQMSLPVLDLYTVCIWSEFLQA